ncbi:MAG: hypothetical protein KF764_09670 [Labilithrix sp.]|nr:hypothetical protein [Labilithrix sp.]
MRPSRLPLLAAMTAAGIVGTAACSHIFELPGAGEPPPAGEPDAAPIDDAEAPVEDAPAPVDAPPPIPFCATRTAPSLWCEDFDGTPAPTLGSIGALEVTGGQLVLSNAVSLSVPRALLASVREGTDATTALTHGLGAAPDGVTLSFHLLVSAWNTTGARISQIELGGPDDRCEVRLEGSATTWSLTQVCEASGVETARTTFDSLFPIVRGRWQRVAIEIAFTPTPSVTLDIDGARIGTAGVAPLQPASTSVTLGAKLVPAGSVTLFQDNVLVTSP